MKSFSRLLLAALILILAACNTQPTTAPTSTSAPPTDTPAPPPSPTANPTANPTATLTPRPAPTNTRTPAASPTPLGFYQHPTAGFSVAYPPGWRVQDSKSNTVVIGSEFGGLLLYVFTSPANEAEKLEDIVADLRSSVDYPVTEQGKGQTTIGGKPAAYVDLLFKRTSGDEAWRIIYYFANRRSYLISFITKPGGLPTFLSTAQKIQDSFIFQSSGAANLPADQTLSLLGGEPDVKELDPALTLGSMDDYIGMLYSTLVRLTFDLQIAPELAEKWTVSPDGLVYTFTLRPDLKFASGAPLTARDVAASWERACDPATGSSSARTYLGDILGAMDKLDKKADTIRGLKVIDERTLQVTIDAPKPYFLGKLTYPTAAVLNLQSVKPKTEDWVWQPDPSGPFLLKEHRKDLLLTFERNPNYFAPPAIQYVTFNLEPGGSAFSLYEDGSIDMVGVGSPYWKRVSDPASSLNKEFQSVVALCSNALRFDLNRPPFDDLNVRKAFTLAFDRSAFIEQPTLGYPQIPAVGILPPSMPGHLADRPETPFDTAAAKQALAASKYAGSLPEITFGAPGYADSNRRDIGLLVEQWQKSLGVKVKVLYIDPVNYTKNGRESNANIFLQGWCADYPDPENFLDVLYHSKSEFNIAKTSLPALDTLLEKARTAPEVSARLALYQQAETLLLDSYLSLPLTYTVQGQLVKPWVKGYALSPMGVVYLRFLSLEGKKP